jgi:hypothetical protein
MTEATTKTLLRELVRELLDDENFRLEMKELAQGFAVEFAKASERIREDGIALFVIQWAESRRIGLTVGPKGLQWRYKPSPELRAALACHHDLIVRWLKEHQADGLTNGRGK